MMQVKSLEFTPVSPRSDLLSKQAEVHLLDIVNFKAVINEHLNGTFSVLLVNKSRTDVFTLSEGYGSIERFGFTSYEESESYANRVYKENMNKLLTEFNEQLFKYIV